MMYDPLALDRQRQTQTELARRVARAPQPSREPKPPREAHRRHSVQQR